MDIQKKDAKRAFRSDGLKKGRSGGARRASRGSKRGSRARTDRVIARDLAAEKEARRADAQGYSTRVRPYNGGHRATVLRNGQAIVWADVSGKQLVAPAIRSMLRMLNKMGSPSTMADASRDRAYCDPDRRHKGHSGWVEREIRFQWAGD